MVAKAVITEKLVKEKIKKIIDIFLGYIPIYSFCPMTFGYGESGHPDRVVLINGTYIGIEVKKDKNNHHCRPELKPKPNEVMQKRQAEKIRSAGGEWICVHNDNIQEFISLLCVKGSIYLGMFSPEHQEQLTKLVG